MAPMASPPGSMLGAGPRASTFKGFQPHPLQPNHSFSPKDGRKHLRLTGRSGGPTSGPSCWGTSAGCDLTSRRRRGSRQQPPAQRWHWPLRAQRLAIARRVLFLSQRSRADDVALADAGSSATGRRGMERTVCQRGRGAG